MLWSLLYLILGCVFQLLVLLGRGDRANAIEVVVLRHQVAGLRRQVNRPDLQPGDRVVLAALSRLLPRTSWNAFFVTLATLLRCRPEPASGFPYPHGFSSDQPSWSSGCARPAR
ncbi:hypothetical protein [Microtetraspora malaysiensis]|uniref:hypothetical protein n=1 Tax=Microtetraspora malaysiensis TaxID=161358 RepID=UPI003D92D7FE